MTAQTSIGVPTDFHRRPDIFKIRGLNPRYRLFKHGLIAVDDIGILEPIPGAQLSCNLVFCLLMAPVFPGDQLVTDLPDIWQLSGNCPEHKLLVDRILWCFVDMGRSIVAIDTIHFSRIGLLLRRDIAGETISMDCEACHIILAEDEANPKILETIKGI